MSKISLNFSDLESVVGGRVYVVADNNAVYVSDGADAVVISQAKYEEVKDKYTNHQIIELFKGKARYECNSLDEFKERLGPIGGRIFDVYGKSMF